MSGKRAFLELLKQEGVEFIFGNPGTTELPLMDALATETELRYVLALQEAALLSMADGYAQASGKLAAVNLHVAPGLGNAMGMLYDAQKSGAPLLITAGQHEQGFNVSEPILWADLPAMARPLVKWSSEVHDLAELPRMVHRAAKTAMAPPTGPVFLSLPGDILKDEGDVELGAATRIGPGLRGDRDALEAAAAMLASAERPLLIAGDAVAQSRAHAEVAALAELIGAPVYPEGVCNTASFPTSHPLAAAAMTRLGHAIRAIVDQHDVIFSIGGDLFTLSLPSHQEPFAPGARIIHLDLDPWEIGKNFPAEVAILAEPKAALPELTELTRARMSKAARAAAAERVTRITEANRAEREALKAKAKTLVGKSPVEPLALLDAIGEMLPKDAVVVEEALSSGPGIRSLIVSDDPQSFYGLRGGGIGWGLPAAIGVKLALPDRPVVALIGDGSAMYTMQALWTAAHYNIAVTFVILNNTSYRILKQRLQALRGHAEQTGHYPGMNLVDPAIDFIALAGSLGVAGERVATVSDATAAIRRGIESGKPLLVEVAMQRGL